MTGPHQNQPVRSAGAPLDSARAAMIMVHGRGGSPEDMLSLARFIDRADVAYLAPRAAGHTWYPYPFMSPISMNEPGITSAMQAVRDVLEQVEAAGIGPERTVLLGFSQGACLATEFAARHARRYGGVVGFSGGLIGPDDTPRDYPGTLDATPVFLGCSDIDPHIPETRVRLTAEVLERLGGAVTLRIYPGMGHTVVEDEIAFVQEILDALPDA